MDLKPIGTMSLKNSGGFIARIQFQYKDASGNTITTSNDGGNILLGQTETEDPGSLGVPNNSQVWLHVDVAGGKDATAKESFMYVSGNACTAEYVISGTTLHNTLALIEVKCP
jgi:hypothetical protein